MQTCIHAYMHLHIYIHADLHAYQHTYIHYTTLHYTTLHYTTHHITSHHITLHYIHTYRLTYTHTYRHTYRPNLQSHPHPPTGGEGGTGHIPVDLVHGTRHHECKPSRTHRGGGGIITTLGLVNPYPLGGEGGLAGLDLVYIYSIYIYVYIYIQSYIQSGFCFPIIPAIDHVVQACMKYNSSPSPQSEGSKCPAVFSDVPFRNLRDSAMHHVVTPRTSAIWI